MSSDLQIQHHISMLGQYRSLLAVSEAMQEMRLLLEVNNSVVSHLDLGELLKAIAGCFRHVIPHDAARLTLLEATNNQFWRRVRGAHSISPLPGF